MSVSTTYTYTNGAKAKIIDGKLTYIKYDSGDKVWFKDNAVVSYYTHDDLVWGDQADDLFRTLNRIY